MSIIAVCAPTNEPENEGDTEAFYQSLQSFIAHNIPRICCHYTKAQYRSVEHHTPTQHTPPHIRGVQCTGDRDSCSTS